MEILHLLPAALETLFSVYWLNACHFCTVDVNNRKKENYTGVMRKQRPVHTHVNVKYVAPKKKKIQSSIFCCWINIRLVMTSLLNCYWAQGQTTPHRCFCTNFCQCFLLFLVIDWLDFIDNGTWHLLWFEICGQVHLSMAVKSQMQLLLDQEKYRKLWIEPSSHAQRRAVLGYTKIYDHFC